jgi:hypothetical protein
MATRGADRGRPALVLARNPDSPPTITMARVAMGDQTKLFDTALAASDREYIDLETCRVCSLTSKMEVRRGQAGDRERALALLATARGPFESIGMPGWLRRADELRQQL